MAQLPGDGTVPTQRPVDQPAKIAHEPDPSQVSSVLSAFYSGVHRAAAEELGLDLRSAQTSQAER
jgi:hypothetical protein